MITRLINVVKFGIGTGANIVVRHVLEKMRSTTGDMFRDGLSSLGLETSNSVEVHEKIDRRLTPYRMHYRTASRADYIVVYSEAKAVDIKSDNSIIITVYAKRLG